MTGRSRITAALGGVLLLAAAQTASAGGTPDGAVTLNAWKSKARALVGETMVEPERVGRERPESGRLVVSARVGAEGTVHEAELTKESANLPLTRAGRDFIERLDRLPPLKGVVEGGRAIVHINLLYAGNRRELKAMQEQVVEIRRIAERQERAPRWRRAARIDLAAGRAAN